MLILELKEFLQDQAHIFQSLFLKLSNTLANNNVSL